MTKAAPICRVRLFGYAVENRDFMCYHFLIFDSLFSFVRTPYMICKIFSKAFL